MWPAQPLCDDLRETEVGKRESHCKLTTLYNKGVVAIQRVLATYLESVILPRALRACAFDEASMSIPDVRRHDGVPGMGNRDLEYSPGSILCLGLDAHLDADTISVQMSVQPATAHAP